MITAAAALMAAGILPAGAADPQLVNLVMSGATVVAGVNVDQAKTSAFGQYLISQLPSQELQQLATATGFNPTQDVDEVLAASGGPVACNSLTPCQQPGLLLARGTFNAAQIAAAAAAKGGTTTVNYNGVAILEGPKQTHGVAFLSNNTIAVAGDIASVEAAIDRQSAATASLPAAVIAAINQWSGSEDAWVITTVPPNSLHSSKGMPTIPGVGQNGLNNSLQNILSAAAGVKFGDAAATVTAQPQADKAAAATAMANALQLLASMAQLQDKNNAELQALVQSLKVTADATALNITFSLPESDLQALLKPHAAARPHHRPVQ
jgi:hypothetical protein